MTGAVHAREVAGVVVLDCAADGADLGDDAAARALIGEAFSTGARWIILPVSRLDAAFFDLKTRIAGEVLQKFVNYGFSVAIVGDVSTHVAASKALTDFVRESNRGRTVWFMPTMAAFEEKLAASDAR